jgi:signal peptidase II
MSVQLFRRSSRVVVLLACLVTIGCDRVTKHAAAVLLSDAQERSFLADTVRLSYAQNTGGFLSVGADLPAGLRILVFTVAAGLLLAGLTTMAIRHRWHGARLLGAALIVAGGASNWIDRAVGGAVVDFLNVGVGSVRTGIFNVADVAIMTGICLIVMTGSRRLESRPSIRKDS